MYDSLLIDIHKIWFTFIRTQEDRKFLFIIKIDESFDSSYGFDGKSRWLQIFAVTHIYMCTNNTGVQIIQVYK